LAGTHGAGVGEDAVADGAVVCDRDAAGVKEGVVLGPWRRRLDPIRCQV